MELQQLTLEIREVYYPCAVSQALTCHVQVLGQLLKHKVRTMQSPFKSTTVLTSEMIRGDTTVQVQILIEGEVKAAAQFQLDEFFTGGLKGERENWILLNDRGKTEEEREDYTQVKLWMSLQPLVKPKRKPLQKSNSTSNIRSACPYVTKLETVMKQDFECIVSLASDALSTIRTNLLHLFGSTVTELESKSFIELESASEGVPNVQIEVPELGTDSGLCLTQEIQEHLKNVLFALGEKVKGLKTAEAEIERLRKENASVIAGRKDLEQSLNDTTKQLRDKGVKTDKYIGQLQEERSAVVASLQTETALRQDLEIEISRLQKEKALLQRELTIQKAKDVESGNLKSELSTVNAHFQDSEKRRNSLQQELAQICSLLQTESKRHKEVQTKWLSEKDSLLQRIYQKDKLIDELQGSTDLMQSEIHLFREERKLQTDLELQIRELQNEVQAGKSRENELREQLQELLSALTAHRTDLDERTSQSISERQGLTEELTQKTKALDSRVQEMQESHRIVIDLQNSVTTLEQLCCNKEDLHQLHEQALAQCRAYQDAKDLLYKELMFLSEYLLTASQTRFDLSRIALTLSDKVSSKEDELDQLKEIVSKLKRRLAVYVPVKVRCRQDDPTDVTLADYLNNRETPLMVPFKREQPEIYTFGSKRIFVKLENGKIASNCPHSPSGWRVHDHR